MRMMNRAIEDAADFGAFRDELLKKMDRPNEPQRIDGESRTQRRARERAERKAAARQPKVRA